jgi:Secretion system C-terminal sorting domain/PKD-like domain/SprB repeat
MRFKTSLFAFFIGICSLLAQKPCDQGFQTPADRPTDACIYCDLSGTQYNTFGYKNDTLAGCGIIPRGQWFMFQAACNSMTIIARPDSNTTAQTGLSMAAMAFANQGAVLACKQGVAGEGKTPSVLTIPTIPGQHYLLVIGGDPTLFDIFIAPPTCAGIFTLPTTQPLLGPAVVCPSIPQYYEVPKVSNATDYIWEFPQGVTMNGQSSPVYANNAALFTFPLGAGNQTYTICVRPRNACTEGTKVCLTVESKLIAPVTFPQVTICQDDLPFVTPWGETVYLTGLYENENTTSLGCDSTLRIFVTVRPPIVRVLPPILAPCPFTPADSVLICGKRYGPGTHTAICTAASGCDSTVLFTVAQLGGSFTAQNTGVSPVANPNIPTGSITATVSGGQMPYTYTWTNDTGQVISTELSPTGLFAGGYTLIVTDANGCQSIPLTVFVTLTVATQDIENAGKLRLNPNPAAHEVRLSHLTDQNMRIQSIEIWNTAGQLVHQMSDYLVNDPIDVGRLSSGMYLVKAQMQDGYAHLKLVRM